MMSREHHRWRSPESSRRRRKERRDSREQLQSHPIPAAIPSYEEPYPRPHQQPHQPSHQQPYQEGPYQSPYQPEDPPARDRDRDRGYSSSFSSTTSSSSTSSSLLNISQPARRFGIGSFFSGNARKQRRRIKKKRSKILRFGNSSSSSVGSDLAYGRGYVDRRRSREFSPPAGQRPPARDSDPERPRPPRRAQTDEEIIELGRKFAELARQQNTDDLRAAGRARPSTLASAATALNQFRRTNSGNLNKGIGNSKPRRDSSPDDSDWESASSDDESGEGESDNGLAYGSAHHLQSNSGRLSHSGAFAQPTQPHSHNIPLNRKRSLVDPKLFGPINSLRGFVQTPCGFDRVDRNAVVHDVYANYDPSVVPDETVVSAETRPMQHVYPVPTSDPSRYDAGRGSTVSVHQGLTSSSRPDPVPIQQPKPIAPVYRKVFDSVDTDPKLTNKPSSTRAAVSTGGIGLPDAATNSPLSSDAAIGSVFRAARRADQSKYHDSRPDDPQRQPERSGDAGHDSKHEMSDGRDALRGIPPDRSYEEEREVTRNNEKERRRREKRESNLNRDLRSETQYRDEYHDSLHHTARGEREMNDTRDDRKENRKESRTENHREKPREDPISVREPTNNVPAPLNEPILERSKGTIDPFQFQVADDAFPTPRHGTPMRPLTPVIMTVDREPNFSKLESSEPYERLSRKDSFERELRDAQNAYKAAEQATAPVDKAAFAAAAAVEMTEGRRKRSLEGASIARDRSQDSSSSSRPKDPVLDDADRAYREARLARRIQAQEERSRSNSPDSVVDKWEDKHPANAYRVTTPPALDHPKQKNPFDGPNADVRIDNVLEHPKELSRFRISESRRRSSTFPVFSARDPSAERERPMLNLVRPTPAPSPIPEKQLLRKIDIPPPTTEVNPDSGPAVTQDQVTSTPSVAPSKAVTWGENQTKHYVIESSDREDDPYSGTKIVTPAETHRSRTNKKSGWGAITAAISGVGVGIAASSVSDDYADKGVRREDYDSKEPGQSKRTPSLQFDSLYDDPPTPGPKPSSPRNSQMPGRFTEDPVFMANIAAGLEGSGFDPNIIIDDAKFHHRDSPPGSNEPLGLSTISTSQATKDDQNRGDTSLTLREQRNDSTEGKDISSNSSEIFSRLSKRERRKQEKAAKQGVSDKSVQDVHDNTALPASNLHKEQERSAENQIWEVDQVPGDSSSTHQELELAPNVDVMTETTPKKKKPKKSRKAIVIQRDSPHDLEPDSQQMRTIERSEDKPVDTSSAVEDIQAVEPEVDWTAENNDTEANYWDLGVRKFNASLESTSRDPEPAIDDSSSARPEEWTAPSKGKEKTRRDSLVDESVPSHKSLELSRESSYAIVEPGVRPAPADEGNLSRKGKERPASTETDSLPRSRYVSKVLEELMKRNAGDKVSELVNKADSVDDWDNSVVGEKEPERDPSPSRRTSLINDSINSPKNLTDSFGDLPRETVAATEEDWVDLPKKAKKKKKKPKRDAATREDSPSASPAAPRSGASVLKDDSFIDLPSRPNAPEPIPEDEEPTKGDKNRSAEQSGFPKDTDSVDEHQLPDMGRELPGSQNKNERNSSSFFGRLKSSIGFSDGKEQSQTPKDEANSFLDNAGALGTSAGLTNSAIALALQRLTGKAPDTAAETSPLEETKPAEWRPSSPETELIDPEIVEREIRPAIDPTYGDLLPLPPSRPSTPVPALDESIPPLPESRPGTPEDERERRLLAQKSAHNRRRSDIPLRVKTPSQSAIPIQFRLGQRTTPGSPSVLKQSPSASPTITTAPETGSASKARARPMSWESSKSFMPLFLVERSRESVTPPASLQEEPHSSDLPDAGVDVSSPTSNHAAIPRDDVNDSRLIQEYTAQPLGSPELPPLKPVEEPESPTPKPDPVDAVTKNRSSYLLYSSPPGPQNPSDGDASEGSPSLRAAKRQMALDEVEEDLYDEVSGSDPLVTTAAGLATSALAADALVEDDARSPEFSLDTRDSTILGVALSGSSTELRETINTDETGVKDNEPNVVTISPAKKSKKGKKGKNKSRDIEPLAGTLDEEASVESALSQNSDTLELAMITDEKEEEHSLAKISKKEKKKKKKEQSRALSIEGEKAVETAPAKDQEDEFFDAPAPVEQAMVEPQAQQAEIEIVAEAHTATPAESIVKTPATAPAEATVERPIKAPTEASVEVPAEIPTELPIEAHIDAFAQTPPEALGTSATESPVEHTAGTVSAVPIVATVVATAEIPIEAPVKTTDSTAIEPTLDTLLPIVNETSAESTIKAPDEAPVGTAVKALTETPPAGESVVTSKKGKKKKRKSQASQLEAEAQPLTVPQSETLEETVLPAINENASGDGPILTHKEIASEQEASSAAPETAAADSIQDKEKKGNPSAPSEEEPMTTAILDMTTSTELGPSIMDQDHAEPREANFLDQGSEDFRDLPAVAENILSEAKDLALEYAPQVASVAEDIPATTSKKSKKKKKKASQVLEPEQQTSTVVDSENPLETVEEIKQSEAELRLSKASDATEGISSVQATPVRSESPLDTLPEAVVPLPSNELNEKLDLASETPQALVDIMDSALPDEERSEGKKLSTQDEDGQQIQTGEPSSVSLQGPLADTSHSSPPNDENEPQSKADALSSDEIQRAPELTDASKSWLTEEDVEDLNTASTSNNLLDIAGDSQPSASDQVAGDGPAELMNELEEAPSKKKAKKKKKKQSASNMSDAQEPTLTPSKTEFMHEKPAEDALSTDHAIEPMVETTLVLEKPKAPADTTLPESSSSVKDSKIDKEGEEDSRDAVLDATENVEGSPKSAGDAAAMEDQATINTETSVAPSEAEPTANEPSSERTTPTKKNKKKSKKNRQSADSLTPTEASGPSSVEPNSAVAENVADTAQPESHSTLLDTLQIVSLTEKEMPELEPDVEAYPNKPESVKLDPVSSDTIPETADSFSTQQDTFLGPQSSDAAASLVEPVIDIPDPDISQVLDKAEDFSSSHKKPKKNKKRQDVTLMEDEDISDLPGPIPETLLDLKDVRHIPEQVKEDDADVSSASTRTEKSKKEKKKKKRQSVQFVEPIEETREIPAEGNDKTVASEISAAEPDEESLDSLNARTVPSVSASSSLGASYNLDQGHDARTVQGLSETPFLNFDHPAVPLLAEGDLGADQLQGVFNSPVPPTDKPQEETLEQPNQGEAARADQTTGSQPHGDIETRIQTHPQDDSEMQKLTDSLPEVVESDIKSDARTATNDQVLSEDKSSAEVMPMIENSIQGTINDDSLSTTKKSKKDKRKRKGKSVDSQESASDPASLTTTTGDGVDMGEDKETSSILLSEFPIQSSKDGESEEPATVKHTVADKLIDEEPAVEQSITEQASTKNPAAEEQDVKEPVVGASIADAPSVQEATVDQPAVEYSTATEQTVMEEAVAQSTAEEQVERPEIEEASVENIPAGEKAVDDLNTKDDAIDNSAGERTSAEELGIEAPTTDNLPVQEQAAKEPISEEPIVEMPPVEVPAIENPIAEERVIDTAVEAPLFEIPLVEDLAFEEPAVQSPQADITPETTTKKSKKGKKGKKANKVSEDEPVQLPDVAPGSVLDDGTTSQDNIVNTPQTTLLKEADEAAKASDISKPLVDEQGLSSEVPPAALPSAPNDQTQSSQDNQIITQISHPENEAAPLVEPAATDVGIEELAALTTPEPEHFRGPPDSETQSETTTRKSKKDKKKKKRESQLLVDQLDATQTATTDPIVNVESPVTVTEQTTTSSLPNASENETTSAPYVEFHTADRDAHPGTEPVSTTPTVPAVATPINLVKSSKPPSDQLPIDSEISSEVTKHESAEKDEPEQASSWEFESSLVEPKELPAEEFATVQISESADPSIRFLPEESKDDGNLSYASAEKSKKDEELASRGDEEAILELPIERVPPVSDNLDPNDAIPPTQPDNSQNAVSSKSEDAQGDDAVNVEDAPSLTPTKQSKKGKKKKKSTSSTAVEVTSELQPEPVQIGSDGLEQIKISLPTESEGPSVEEPPKIEQTEDKSALITTKKSKKKKKKAVDGEEILREVQTDLASSIPGEGEQSDVFTAIPTQASEQNLAVESVSKEADTLQDKTIPPGETVLEGDISLEDVSAPGVDDHASNEPLSKTESKTRDVHTTQTTAVVQGDGEKDTPTDDKAPKVQDDSQDETVSKAESTPPDGDATQGEIVDKDSQLRDDNNAPRSEPVLDNKAAITDEGASQDKAVPDSQPSEDSAPTKKSKKNKKKKKQSTSQVDELTEGILADNPIPAGTVDSVQPVGEEMLVQPASSQIDGDSTELTVDKVDEEKRAVSLNDEVSERQLATESPLAAANNISRSVEDETAAPESSNDGALADLSPVEKDKKSSPSGDEVSEEKLSASPAIGIVDSAPIDFPVSQTSNEDGAALPISTKKSKKDKKKKKQMASQEDESTQQASAVEDLPEAQKDLPQDSEPQQDLPEEDLSREGRFKDELLQEEQAGEVTQETPILEEQGQISLSQESPPQTPLEPATVLKQEVSNEEATEIDSPPKDDVPSHTPTKKGKKDKKKKESGSSTAEVISQVETVQLEDNQPLAVGGSVFESELPREGEASVAVIPAEIKEDDVTQLTPTKKSKKEKKKKKQALLESNLTEETVETSTEVVSTDAPGSSERAEAEVSELTIDEDAKAVDDISSTKTEEGEKEKQSTVLQDDSISQPASGQEPDISTTAATEVSTSEGLLELALGGKKKKDKKKKRASVLESKPEPEPEPEPKPERRPWDGSESTTGPVDAAEMAQTGRSRWLGEQPSVQRTKGQSTILELIKALRQDKGKDSSHLDASAQELDTTLKEETTSSTQPGEAVESNIAPVLSIAPVETVSTDATQELSSQDQTTLRAAETEPIEEAALEAALETDNPNPTPSQEPQTVQLEEAAPKVDDGMDIVSSKKSKKDKKKKKRASQVSWELGPEAEIEDLPEQQQPERTLDEQQPMTTDTKEMGDGGKAVEDPFSEFASDEKSKKQKRQKQMDSEPEPNSETVEESEPLHPTEQGQHNDMLPDHQSLAGDTQTSLKHSTDLDDTLLETTFSKKSTTKKDSRLDGDADPATLDAPVSAADPILVDQGIIDNYHELVGTPLAEASEAMLTEANVEEFHESVSAKLSKKDELKARTQSTTENPEHEIDTGQLARSSSQISLSASKESAPAEDASVNLEQSSVSYEQDLAKGQCGEPLTEKAQLPVNAAQAKEGLSQLQSISHDTNTKIGPMSIDRASSHDTVPDDDGSFIFPGTLERGLDKAAEEVQAQESKDTVDHSQVLLQKAPESSTTKSKKEKRKAEAVQGHDVSDADSSMNAAAHLQSWDWSNIDRKSQSDTVVPETVSISEDLSQAGFQVTPQPGHTLHTINQDDLTGIPNTDTIETTQPELVNTETEGRAGPSIEGSPITRKKSKKDKKRKKGASQSESETVSGVRIPRTKALETSADLRVVAPSSPKAPEIEIIDEQDDGRIPSGTKSKGDNKLSKALVSEETPLEPQITLNVSRDISAPQQQSLDEISRRENQDDEARSHAATHDSAQPQVRTAVTNDAAVEIVETGQFVASKSRPQTPLLDGQASITVDMSPAQLSSHIEHDRPFDHSTQPDKKLRTRLVENDTILPEPLSAMAVASTDSKSKESKPQTTSPIVDKIQSLVEEFDEQGTKDEVVDSPPGLSINVTRLEPNPMNIETLQASSNEDKLKGPGLIPEDKKVMTEGSSTTISNKKAEKEDQVDENQNLETAAIMGAGAGAGVVVDVIEKLGESKKEKEKKKLKRADKKLHKEDGAVDASGVWEKSKHKRLEEGDSWVADSADFSTGPNTEAEAQSKEAYPEIAAPEASEEVPKLAQHQDHSVDKNIAKSLVVGREMVPGFSRPPRAEETGPQMKEASTTEAAQINLDDKTSLQQDTHHQSSPRFGVRDVTEEPSLTLLTPSRTPSALDYRRSLPPVEEETHEDLQKDLQSGVVKKASVEPEANRDSGFITESPNPQRHSLGLDDSGQRDSGVHMRGWTEETTPGPETEKAGSEKSNTGTMSNLIDNDNDSQTPQPQERRSRRSLFDSETPKLSTPTQGRGWERGATPEKPGEEEPTKRTTTPLTSRATKYQDLALSRDAGGGAALRAHTPQQQSQRSVSDNVSSGNIRRESTTTTPRLESVARRSTSSNTSISRLRTPELSKVRPESPGSHSVHSIRSLRSSGANTPPLRRVDRRMSGDLRALSHNSSTPSLHSSTREPREPTERDTAKDASSDRHVLSSTITPIANEGRVRAKDMTDVYVSPRI
ncbi:hypothetical protein F5Y03DRAFT_239719 [Xylaria venustula]|nr:hypothetical protein F5Y03DRAFT_239719 [Xylaria venustula]